MDYTKLTDFATKDALLSGNPSKLVRGTELDAEFGAIVTAVATKTDDSAAAITGGTIDGTVIGGVTPAATTVSSLTDSGNLTFTGTANRIRGDFSNSTVANRVMFQTSTVNGNTLVSAIPNGTAVIGQFGAANSSDPANASFLNVLANSTDVSFRNAITGTGTYLPMTFYTGGSERMRLSTAGTFTVGESQTDQFPTALVIQESAHATSRRANMQIGSAWLIAQDANGNGTKDFFIYDNIAGAVRLLIDTSGNVTLSSATGSFGYGAGAGGTVTQATSKATTVTLNKPTGQITTAADALAASTRVSFLFNNSLIGTNDVLVLTPAVSGGSYNVQVIDSGTGVAYIEIFNKSAGSRSEAIAIKFAIIKGATA